MTKELKKDLIVGLDIGTSKIAALVAEVAADGTLNVIGLGTQPSRGLRKGVVVNIDATMASIQRAIEEAEAMANCRISEVYTGIAGSHIRSLNSSGMVAIKEKEVMQADVDRVMDTAKAVAIPNDQQILHILPQEFIIDGQDGVKEPLGMSGVRLEVKVHIVTGAVSAVENIVKCVRRCGLTVNDVMLQPLASATAVLNEDEQELGVCLMDIGGGTTDLAVFANGAIRHTAVIPIAGDQVTNDIAMTLAHADEGSGGAQSPSRLRAAPACRPHRDRRGARCRRARTAQALAADACRSHRAAHRGALFARAGGASPLRVRGAAVVGHRDHRRYRAARRHGRARRGGLPSAGAHRRTDLRRADSPMSYAIRAMRPPSACCSRDATSGCAPRPRATRPPASAASRKG